MLGNFKNVGIKKVVMMQTLKDVGNVIGVGRNSEDRHEPENVRIP